MKAKITYKEPAKKWSQGCLLGNGFMGEVIYGGVSKETIDLSETTFFSGEKETSVYQENASDYFHQMRKEAINQNHAKVKELTKHFMGKRGNYGTNLPVGQLELFFERQAAYEGYERILDLNKGICQIHNGKMKREAFSSYVDQVFCYQILNESKEGIHFSIKFKGKEEASQVFMQENRLCFTCKALETLHSDGTKGVELLGVVKVSVTDGEVIYHKDYIEVKNAHKAVIYLAMDTTFTLEEDKKTLDFNILYERTNYKEQEYALLKDRHITDFEGYMKRQYIQIEQDELTCLMHQFGRYLLLSSSRETSKLPAHLQGVWNDNVACKIGWSCDMHLDINTQMNYWISESGNLSECHTPLFEWMEKAVIPNGRKTAGLCYGKKGWVAELVSNAWGYAAPYWNESLSPCPVSGIWTTSDYMEHYRFTNQSDFLKKQIAKVLTEAVEFFSSYIFLNRDGYYVAGPSISPENAFGKGGETFYASIGCTFEMIMIRELFKDYMEMMEILQKESELLTFVKDVYPKLLPYELDDEDRIKEWNHKEKAIDLQHRHTSHLLGLFPYHQINHKDTPMLIKAAQKTIQAKLTPYENWEDTGWARNLLILYSARLQDSKMAFHHVLELQRNLTNEGLLVMHPPTRGAYSFADVYELDGNTGFAMAVIEMIIQCFDDEIKLFPALPGEWKSGKAKGILLRGGMCVDLTWDLEQSITICIRANTDKTIRLTYQEIEQVIQLTKDKKEMIVLMNETLH